MQSSQIVVPGFEHHWSIVFHIVSPQFAHHGSEISEALVHGFHVVGPEFTQRGSRVPTLWVHVSDSVGTGFVLSHLSKVFSSRLDTKRITHVNVRHLHTVKILRQ